ncbi:MAG: hypothetical protein ABIP74_00550 [Candidatus Saccharimonas sp.]
MPKIFEKASNMISEKHLAEMFNTLPPAWLHADAIEMEPMLINALADKVVTKIRERLTTRRSTDVAPLYDILSIRVMGVTFTKWARARVLEGDSVPHSFEKIGAQVTKKVGELLDIDWLTITYKNELSKGKVTFKFEQPLLASS